MFTDTDLTFVKNALNDGRMDGLTGNAAFWRVRQESAHAEQAWRDLFDLMQKVLNAQKKGKAAVLNEAEKKRYWASLYVAAQFHCLSLWEFLDKLQRRELDLAEVRHRLTSLVCPADFELSIPRVDHVKNYVELARIKTNASPSRGEQRQFDRGLKKFPPEELAYQHAYASLQNRETVPTDLIAPRIHTSCFIQGLKKAYNGLLRAYPHKNPHDWIAKARELYDAYKASREAALEKARKAERNQTIWWGIVFFPSLIWNIPAYYRLKSAQAQEKIALTKTFDTQFPEWLPPIEAQLHPQPVEGQTMPFDQALPPKIARLWEQWATLARCYKAFKARMDDQATFKALIAALREWDRQITEIFQHALFKGTNDQNYTRLNEVAQSLSIAPPANCPRGFPPTLGHLKAAFGEGDFSATLKTYLDHCHRKICTDPLNTPIDWAHWTQDLMDLAKGHSVAETIIEETLPHEAPLATYQDMSQQLHAWRMSVFQASGSQAQAIGAVDEKELPRFAQKIAQTWRYFQQPAQDTPSSREAAQMVWQHLVNQLHGVDLWAPGLARALESQGITQDALKRAHREIYLTYLETCQRIVKQLRFWYTQLNVEDKDKAVLVKLALNEGITKPHLFKIRDMIHHLILVFEEQEAIYPEAKQALEFLLAALEGISTWHPRLAEALLSVKEIPVRLLTGLAGSKRVLAKAIEKYTGVAALPAGHPGSQALALMDGLTRGTIQHTNLTLSSQASRTLLGKSLGEFERLFRQWNTRKEKILQALKEKDPQLALQKQCNEVFSLCINQARIAYEMDEFYPTYLDSDQDSPLIYEAQINEWTETYTKNAEILERQYQACVGALREAGIAEGAKELSALYEKFKEVWNGYFTIMCVVRPQATPGLVEMQQRGERTTRIHVATVQKNTLAAQLLAEAERLRAEGEQLKAEGEQLKAEAKITIEEERKKTKISRFVNLELDKKNLELAVKEKQLQGLEAPKELLENIATCEKLLAIRRAKLEREGLWPIPSELAPKRWIFNDDEETDEDEELSDSVPSAPSTSASSTSPPVSISGVFTPPHTISDEQAPVDLSAKAAELVKGVINTQLNKTEPRP